ncbi:MAG: polysaccharide deacetylase family protein [Bacillota bacterium]|nr:polysaccharide deacetylase family protein [Bacillota bacterium]
MRMYVLTKKNVYAIILCLVFAILLIGVNFDNVATFVSTGSVHRSLPIYRVRTNDKRIAISFDAAWGNEDTQTLIDILGKYNVKATFFVVGSWVDKYPESVKALHDAGHDVMNHSSTHPHMPQLSKDKMISEVQNCNDKIEKVTGVRPILFRPPFGDYSNLTVDTMKEIGMYTIQWDVDSLDWKNPPSSDIVARVTSKVKGGSIVLFHNAAINTPAALPAILEKLQSEGYQFVKISDLIYKDNYDIDHAGEQFQKAPAAGQTGTASSETKKDQSDEKQTKTENQADSEKDAVSPQKNADKKSQSDLSAKKETESDISQKTNVRQQTKCI